MSISIQSRERARRMAKLMSARDFVFSFEWKSAAKELWHTMRRRRPVAIIWNSMATRIYQCILCGAELELNNNRNLKRNKHLKKFLQHHNNLHCCDEKSKAQA